MLPFILIVSVLTALDRVQGLAAPTPPTKINAACGVVPPRDCSDIKALGFKDSGAYQVYLSPDQNSNKIDVFCDFDTPGGDWLVFQRRKDGTVDFNRNWNNYTKGFGDVDGGFWLGNQIIHLLTSVRDYKLRVDMSDFAGQTRFAEYSIFSIGPPSDYYRLKIGIYSGNAGDAMKRQNNQPYSTFDVDSSSNGCSKVYKSAWWYAKCYDSNLNGQYMHGEHTSVGGSVEWEQWHGSKYSLKTSEMKISPLR